MTQQGIMREIDLGDMLEGDDAQEILGEDLVWELRSILIEGCGPNLRHRVMHGLAEVTELRSPIVNYLWWLMVHVLVVARLNWEQGCNH